ncbi:hypothetical protein LDENG_00015740 [Lucifuga dentata]|nr:hypothetical protein LDENG_00015740 [Lucifuga dentata]
MPHRLHGNLPKRQITPLPQVDKGRVQRTLEAVSSETGPKPATRAEPNLPTKQPVVSLVRLQCQRRAELHDEVCLDPQQNGFRQNEDDILEIKEESSPFKPAGSSDLSQPETTATSWTEPYCPDSSSSGGQEPEQDSGFDCESNSDQPYILFESESEGDPDVKSESETFYLDPDPEQNIVIQLDPECESDQSRSLEVEDESESSCEMEIVQMDDGKDRSVRCCSPVQMESDAASQQPEPGPGPGPEPEPGPGPEPEPGPGPGVEPGAESEEMESEDFCAVCLNGGDLLCCDRCPKVFHLSCHIPPLTGFPLGDWVCSLCRTEQDAAEAFDSENTHSCGEIKAPYSLSNLDQRARNYYQIIKRPIDLSVIRRKLDRSKTLHYFTADQFVEDVLLMFRNCAAFNYPDSEVAQAGRNLEVFFLSKLKEVFPDRTFPSASQDKTDRSRLRWLNKERREKRNRRKRYFFRGKKYYL